MKDVFVCHASEDKAAVVRPLVEALEIAGISCWLDETEIRWGDSITQRVNDGLSRARFVIVVLSKAFLAKHWPQRELNAVLNQEASSGQIKVLPLVHGDKQSVQEIFTELPLLNDKLFLIWDGNPSSTVTALADRLGRPPVPEGADLPRGSKFNVPLPKPKAGFTDFDRSKFLKEGFRVIRDYFEEGLAQLSAHYPHIQSELDDIHAQKFIGRIYVHGKLFNECNIRIGGFSSNSIGYSEGRFNLHTDNSYNEVISVEDDGNGLFFKFSMGYFGQAANRLHSPTEAAESLWKRFTAQLGASQNL
jgi:hypothetical protein